MVRKKCFRRTSAFCAPLSLLAKSAAAPFCLLPFAFLMAIAHAEAQHPMPGAMASPHSEVNLVTSTDSLLEEGKALYESEQYIAALSKFMTVLRRDPHQKEAREYLRLVMDSMRKNPSGTSGKSKLGGQASVSNAEAQEELRHLLQRRSLFTLDLKAIPGVKVELDKNTAKVTLNSDLLFADNTGGLKEESVPVLDRVSAWLKTFGQQPVIIHSYPEEMQDPSVNGSLFLRRYSELYNFFVQERNMAAQRFVSADLLAQESDPKRAAELNPAAHVTTSLHRVVIETVGSRTALLDAMPAADPRHAMSRWLERSIMASKKVFNPDEGEWVSLEIAALTRTGLREWSVKILPFSSVDQPVFSLEGKGNLLKEVSWDGHDQKTKDFAPSGSYVARLAATDSDGTIMTREVTLQVQRSSGQEGYLENRVHRTAKASSKSKKKKSLASNRRAAGPSKSVAKAAKKSNSKPATQKPESSVEQTPPAAATEANPTERAQSSDSLIDGSKKETSAAPPEETSSAATEEGTDSTHAIWKQVIEFDVDQSALKPTLKASLERIGKTLEVYPLQKVRIVGFAMASEHNSEALAKKRAELVRSVLVDEYHVDRKRVLNAGGRTVSQPGSSKVEMSITN